MGEAERDLNGWQEGRLRYDHGGLLLAVLGMMSFFSGEDSGGGALLVGLSGPAVWIANRSGRRR